MPAALNRPGRIVAVDLVTSGRIVVDSGRLIADIVVDLWSIIGNNVVVPCRIACNIPGSIVIAFCSIAVDCACRSIGSAAGSFVDSGVFRSIMRC